MSGIEVIGATVLIDVASMGNTESQQMEIGLESGGSMGRLAEEVQQVMTGSNLESVSEVVIHLCNGWF